MRKTLLSTLLILTAVTAPATRTLETSGYSAAVRGTLAFVPNRAGTRVPGFHGVPQQLGTHNLRLDRLVPGLDPQTIAPIAVGATAGYSVPIGLDPDAGEPILLRGTWQGSAVTGEWLMHRRAGIDREGLFSLRRTAP